MKLMLGDCLEKLKELPENSVDSIVTDPPYGLGKEPDALAMLKDWIETGHHDVKGSGFMGKEWDAFVPQPILWKEVYRVLKPGGHILCFAGTRTMDLMCLSLRIAGFEMRDSIGYAHESNDAPLMAWCYGSGFPKSLNIGKAVDKLQGNEREQVISNRHTTFSGGAGNSFTLTMNGVDKETGKKLTSKGTSEWEGWGTALKPAWEPIILCRKPLGEKTVAENVLKYGTGGINIDGCRVNADVTYGRSASGSDGIVNKGNGSFKHGFKSNAEANDYANPQGRFPANLILSHSEGCKCVGMKVVKAKQLTAGVRTVKWGVGEGGCTYEKGEGAKFATEDGKETVEQWECVDGCSVKMMDEQSGISKSSGGSGVASMKTAPNDNIYGKYKEGHKSQNLGGLGDTGGASRFFYCAKSSKSERNKGCEAFEEKEMPYGSGGGGMPSGNDNPINTKQKNFHPTVKPIKLMKYLVRLITPKNGICLDPFMGSGTTGIACREEGFDFIGIEMQEDYFKIAEARINSEQKENKFEKKKSSAKLNVEKQEEFSFE